ncbi:hypothetical protein PVAP13_9KG274713 [Panicum virgatum]|uniref:Uncharacterized protein n=2 Tax=Panicum virgatum TaxID=38727 RepID=A0A8T0NM79_PANVG|nr:hypothetical protein PVAP13_9KG274713 [Panicum virgatum]
MFCKSLICIEAVSLFICMTEGGQHDIIAYNLFEQITEWYNMVVDVNEMGIKHTCRFLLGQR